MWANVVGHCTDAMQSTAFFQACTLLSQIPGGGLLPEKLGGDVWPVPKTLNLFMTKLAIFPQPICDLAKNSTPYL